MGALTVGALFSLLPFLLVIALFVMRDRIVDFVVSRIPTSVDSEIGERMYRRLAASGNLVDDGPAVDALRAVGRRFIPHLPTKDFAFRFEVVNDASVNAFAVPGGLVVVHTGLLAKATSVDELAGVLSHEIVHVTGRHSLRQIIYDLGLTTTISWAFGIPEGASVTIAGAAMDLSGLKFSRDQESEADAGGVELLEKAKLPAGGLQSIFEMLARETVDIPAFLSTHPADEQRLATLEKLVSERGTWNVDLLTIDWNAVRLDAETRLKKP
jgi:beta-barrel assembly-enhancing protease